MSEYWLFTATPENFQNLKEDNFPSFGFPPKSRKLAAGIKPGDKCVIYISKRQKLGIICQITSGTYSDEDEDYPLRVNTQPELLLTDEELLDVKKLVPHLSFITPKQKAISWGVAFQSTLRKISEEDFQLIESEMRKIKEKKEAVSEKPSDKVVSEPSGVKLSHQELIEIIENIGTYLGKSVEREWKVAEFRHDVVWKEKPFRTPSVVFEVCDSGSLEKDILALEWARANLPATAILVVAKDSDFDHASRRLPAESETLVVKGKSMKMLCELAQNDLKLLKAVFKNV